MKIIYEGGFIPALGYCDDQEDRFLGWIFAKHPDGQWVSIAKAPAPPPPVAPVPGPDLGAAIKNIIASVHSAANGYHNTQQWGDVEYGQPSEWERIEQAEAIALSVASALLARVRDLEAQVERQKARYGTGMREGAGT